MTRLDAFVATDLVSGALWGLTYLLILRRGVLDRASGVPLPALAAAFAFELLYGVVHPTAKLPPLVIPVWLTLDACIFAQYLHHLGASRTPGARRLLRAGAVAALLAALGIEQAIVAAMRDTDGVWTGYAVNAVMSCAFVARIARRRDVRGQSMAIALAKLAGTLVVVPHALALHGSMASLRALIAVTVTGDVVYAVLLHRACRAQGLRRWRRV